MGFLFKEIKPNKRARLRDSWIHPTGDLALLLDFSKEKAGKDGLEGCLDWLNESITSYSIILRTEWWERLVKEYLFKYPEASVLCLNHVSNCVEVLSFGSTNLLHFTENGGSIVAKQGAIPIKYGDMYVASSSATDHEQLISASHRVAVAKSTANFDELGMLSSIEDDWALIVFPIESASSYINPNWERNPFVGIQEGRDHEKRGLAEVAEALFKEKDFEGFRIVGGNFFVSAYGSRLLDGILISPYGLFLIELKDLYGRILLEPQNENSPVICINGHEITHKETNPVGKIQKVVKRGFSSLNIGVPLDSRLRQGALLVFTHHTAQVECKDPTGSKFNLPHQSGQVLIGTPKTIASQIRSFTNGLLGKNKNNQPFLTPEIIATISDKLGSVQPLVEPTPSGFMKLGRFLVSGTANSDESTTMYTVYDAHVEGKTHKRHWVKCYDLNTMGRGDNSSDEIRRIVREIEALQDLNDIQGVQTFQEYFTEDLKVYVVLSKDEGLTIDRWLEHCKPDRETRLSLLIEIADILTHLEEEKIVHRGITPFNIRVSQEGRPTLINFELCQIKTLETVLPKARELMNLAYQSRESLTPGCSASSSDDIYSFGKLCCLVLSGQLPFRSYNEQVSFVRKAGAWEAFGNLCGINHEQAGDLRRMLSNDRNLRPSGSELKQILHGWKS